jgi:hypothetical protein
MYTKKITFEFHTFEIQKFQTTSDRETTKTKVYLETLLNFVADNFFVLIRLGSQNIYFKTG